MALPDAASAALSEGTLSSYNSRVVQVPIDTGYESLYQVSLVTPGGVTESRTAPNQFDAFAAAWHALFGVFPPDDEGIVSPPNRAYVTWGDLPDLDPAMIASVSASVLPAGSDPTVVLGGTSTARTLAFGIPQGQSGEVSAAQLAAVRPVGWAAVEYADATETVESWANLSSVQSNFVQVIANRLRGSTQANPAVAYVPFVATAGQRFHIATFIDLATAGGTVFVGLATGSGIPVSQPDDVSVGFVTSGASSNVLSVSGSAVSSAFGAGVSGFTNAPAGRYAVTITGDATYVTFGLRSTTDHTRTFTWRVPVAGLTTLGRTWTRIMCYCSDSRAAAGHGVGPVIAVKSSVQPVRTKAVAGLAVEGIAHRDAWRPGVATADNWRYSLPASYDPRVRSPLVLVLHQAQSAGDIHTQPWTDSRDQPLVKALSDAGYIVATAQDGYVANVGGDRYGNAAAMANFADLVAYMRSMYNIGPVVLLGKSMGGLTGGNIIGRKAISKIAAAYFIGPSFDLNYVHNLPGFGPAIDAVYGTPYATTSVGYDPMLRPGTDYWGVPIRCVSASGDTVAPPATHVTPMLDKVRPYVPEASELIVTGTHLAASSFVAADLMAFLDRHITI